MFNQQRFSEVSVRAAQESMKIIEPYASGLLEVGKAEIKKHDKTLVTIVDHKSEEAGFSIIREAFPNVPILREEAGLSQGSDSCIIWNDALDGTKALTCGAPTSTVIWAFYAIANKKLRGVTIGEPAYARIWTTTLSGCQKLIYEKRIVKPQKGVLKLEYELLKIQPCHVWEGELSSQCTVALDVSHGFTRGKEKRQILTDEDMLRLWRNLQSGLEVKMQLWGSNGLNHALVANGGEGLAGAITTAMGGPYDAAGVMLVLEAGGAALGFRVTEDHKLVEADPLDPESYDIVVSANNQNTLERLCNCVKHCV